MWTCSIGLSSSGKSWPNVGIRWRTISRRRTRVSNPSQVVSPFCTTDNQYVQYMCRCVISCVRVLMLLVQAFTRTVVYWWLETNYSVIKTTWIVHAYKSLRMHMPVSWQIFATWSACWRSCEIRRAPSRAPPSTRSAARRESLQRNACASNGSPAPAFTSNRQSSLLTESSHFL